MNGNIEIQVHRRLKQNGNHWENVTTYVKSFSMWLFDAVYNMSLYIEEGIASITNIRATKHKYDLKSDSYYIVTVNLLIACIMNLK